MAHRATTSEGALYDRNSSGTDGKKRITWIDTLRGIAMLLVVLGHCGGISPTAGIIIYAFHMPLFFMISGLLFRVSKYDTLLACVKDKVVKLLVPYACFFVLNIGLQILGKRLLGNPITTKPVEYLVGFLTAGKSGVTSCNALWFLPCLFFVSILYWSLYRLHDQGRLHIGISLALLLEVGLVLDYYNFKGPLWTDCVPMCTVFYGIGHHFMLHHQTIVERLGWRDHRVRYFATVILLIVVGVAAALANGRLTVSGNGYRYFAFSAAHITCLSLGQPCWP